jgi:hypothetical protein
LLLLLLLLLRSAMRPKVTLTARLELARNG